MIGRLIPWPSFWTDEIPGFPSGDWHFQPLLHPHSQRIGEGHCCGEDGARSFLESGSERGTTDHAPCSGPWWVDISLNHSALLPLPTHHPFGLHSSPGLASGSPQLCGIHPTIQQSEPFRLQNPEGPTRWHGHSLDSFTLCLLFMEGRQGIGGFGAGPRLSQLTCHVTLNSLSTSLDFHCLI